MDGQQHEQGVAPERQEEHPQREQDLQTHAPTLARLADFLIFAGFWAVLWPTLTAPKHAEKMAPDAPSWAAFSCPFRRPDRRRPARPGPGRRRSGRGDGRSRTR